MVQHPMNLKLQIRLLLRQLSRSRGVVLRGLICWMIGCILLVNDEGNSYDTRLQLRGDQSATSDIVLITLQPSDLTSSERFNGRSFGPIGEITDITDSFYWDSQLWVQLLDKVLKQNPKKVGVTLFFSEGLGPLHLSRNQLKILRDSRVVWGTSTSLSERVNQPLLSNDLRTNIGSLDLLRDEDGVIRRFIAPNTHLVSRVTGENLTAGSHFINYRGPSGKFTEYSLRDLLDDRIPDQALANKYVLIGSESPTSTQYLTPLGSSHRHEVHAQILDNVLMHRSIYRAPLGFYMAGLFVLMILSVFVITSYPQSVALVFIAWLATLTAALSAWVFDLYYVWIPALSPAVQLAATWVIFIGYQANQIERRNWQLQQERKYLSELEQLKNNFVSLISHDLKTPIAKIQAIVDRLLSNDETLQFSNDLKSLRMSSEELNRYIQSILKVLRVESRDFQLNKEVGDINETIQAAVDQLQPLASEKNITLQVQLEPLFSIEVDFTLIREVLINLIENGIKYTEPGGQIHIASQEIGNKVWIEVADTGEGIPAEEVANVWGKFVRGKDQDLKTKGTGLGLYLVKYFIELHGGEVFLVSELKKGTKVSFSLPLEDSEDVA
jgi:two-component system phosphate regulon sensor histidine kinase PhoR